MQIADVDGILDDVVAEVVGFAVSDVADLRFTDYLVPIDARPFGHVFQYGRETNQAWKLLPAVKTCNPLSMDCAETLGTDATNAVAAIRAIIFRDFMWVILQAGGSQQLLCQIGVPDGAERCFIAGVSQHASSRDILIVTTFLFQRR